MIVDDNKSILTALKLLLGNYFNRVVTLPAPTALVSTLRSEKFDVVLLDMNFSAGINNGNEGLYWLSEVKKESPASQVVLFTAYADIDLAVKAIIDAEKLDATDDEVEAEMKNVADKYGMDLDTVKKYLRPEEVKEQVIREKVIKVVADSAKAVAPAEEKAELEAEGEIVEKPAKKPAAKKTTKKTEGEEKAEKAPAKKPAAKKTAKKDAE